MVNLKDPHLDRVFGALSDRTRRIILSRVRAGERRVGELAGAFSMSAPAISKHLRVLEGAGLIERRKEGRVHFVRLRAEPLEDAYAVVESYRAFWQSSFDQLATEVQTPETSE